MAKRAYVARFNKIKDDMTKTYERRFESTKEHLLGIFRMEVARIMDIYSSNKTLLDTLQTMNHSKLKMLIHQEL